MLGLLIGTAGGLTGTIFHLCVDFVTETRQANNFIIYFLPAGALFVVLLYKLFKKSGNIDTNRVIESIRKDRDIPIVMIPLIFVSTVITHLVGGSAGREGAALQIGGGIVPAFFVGATLGCTIGKLIGMDASIGAVTGFIALFCGVVNCPVASLMLAIEVFGDELLIVFAIVCAVSYMLSGRYSLYESQKIYYSKFEDSKNN